MSNLLLFLVLYALFSLGVFGLAEYLGRSQSPTQRFCSAAICAVFWPLMVLAIAAASLWDLSEAMLKKVRG